VLFRSRDARGVRGMSLEDNQRVIAMLVARDEIHSVLTATENGYGKRTPVTEYPRHRRGTKGMIAIQTSERNGPLVGAALVEPKNEVMLISTTGVLIRTPVESIREMGRSTQGVTLINIDEGSALASIEIVAEPDVDDIDVDNGSAVEGDTSPAAGGEEGTGE
jgi:DNA gyrase subunit A